MSKLIVLTIDQRGNFTQGFPIAFEVWEQGKRRYRDKECSPLPSAPDMPQFYEDWRRKYKQLEGTRDIKPATGQVTHYSSVMECQKATEAFEKCLREWFEHASFRDLRGRILAKVKEDDSAPIIIDTQDPLLRKIPWYFWDLFKLLPKAELALLSEDSATSHPFSRPVSILAIFGSSEGGLKLEDDQNALMTLKRNGASIIPLIQPSRQELHDKLWNQDWDILFFAGHSSSQMANHGGQLQISDGRTITLDDLENDLRKAVERGLKLAIFNSCDGLAIADYLARLGVPNMIVMKEPVPDEIARYFLQYFLEEFSTGKPFYLAVREARHRLQWIERDRENPYPCATWLPIICQNPTEPELVWPSQRPTRNSFWRKAALVGAGLTALAGVVVGGWLVRENIKPPSSSQLDESSISSSLGGRKMIRVNPDKQNGLIAFDNKDFSAAIQHFEASLRKEPNDPEALIFLNNAIAAQQDKLGLKSVLRIAVSVPIGKTPSGSEELLRGVAQAQSEWNCSEIRRVKAAISRSQSLATCIGVNDKLIQVKIYDDKDDPQIAERVARELIQDPSILGAIGHFSSDVTLKAGKIYEDGKLVVISPASTSVSLSNFSDYVFRTPSNDEVAAKNLVNYIRKLGYTKAAVAFDTGNDYSRSLTRMFQDQFVEKGEQTINLPECDLSNPGVGGDSCVSKARQQGAQVLLLTPGNRTTIDVALRVVSANRGKLRLLGGDAMYVPKTLKEFGPQSVDGNLVLSVPWHRSSRPSASERAFIDDFQMLWGTGAVNWRSAAAYEATQAIAEGLHRLGKNPDRSLLRQELLSPDFSAEGVVGLVQFEPSGDRKSTSGVGVLVQVQKVGRDEGGDKYDFVRVK